MLAAGRCAGAPGRRGSRCRRSARTPASSRLARTDFALCDRADADDPAARRRSRAGALPRRRPRPLAPGRDAGVRDRHRARHLRLPRGRESRRRRGACGSRGDCCSAPRPRVRVGARTIAIERERLVLARDGTRRAPGAPTSSGSTGSTPPASKREGRRAGLQPLPRLRGPRDRPSTSAARWWCFACLSSPRAAAAPPAGVRPVPRPHEHLRRPRQPARARAALLVARDRLRAAPPAALASRSTPAPTTSSTSAAARIATSACAPRTCWSTSARRCTRRRPAARSCSASAAATSCSATPTRSAARRSRAWGCSTCTPPRGRAAADRQRGDRASPCPPPARRLRARRRGAGGLREPRRAHRLLGERQEPLGRVLAAATATTVAAASRARAAATRSAPTCTGPLLPKNVWFADWLIARALGPRRRRARAARRTSSSARAHAGARRAAGCEGPSPSAASGAAPARERVLGSA